MKTIKNIILIGILLALLSGCAKVTDDDIKEAEELCSTNGGVSYISYNIGVYQAVCINTATFNLRVIR